MMQYVQIHIYEVTISKSHTVINACIIFFAMLQVRKSFAADSKESQAIDLLSERLKARDNPRRQGVEETPV